MSVGIDYGRGRANVDPKTGIRFGVIPQNALLQAWADESEPVYPERNEDDECSACEQTDECMCEPDGWLYSHEGYYAHCGEDGDIFIERSPYYTHAAYCSPCAPGACYLLSPHEDGARAYCFGPDWFYDDPAPYPIYRVSDGVRVK